MALPPLTMTTSTSFTDPLSPNDGFHVLLKTPAGSELSSEDRHTEVAINTQSIQAIFSSFASITQAQSQPLTDSLQELREMITQMSADATKREKEMGQLISDQSLELTALKTEIVALKAQVTSSENTTAAREDIYKQSLQTNLKQSQELNERLANTLPHLLLVQYRGIHASSHSKFREHLLLSESPRSALSLSRSGG